MLNTVENLENTEIISIVEPIQNDLIKVSTIHLDKYLLFQDNEDSRKLITLLTNNTECVKDIIRIIELIMVDGKIDINDGPLLLSFVKKIIMIRSNDLNISKNIRPDNYINIIKYVLIILTKENILKIPNQDQFITDISKILDNIKMVEEVVEGVEKNCLPIFSCLKRK